MIKISFPESLLLLIFSAFFVSCADPADGSGSVAGNEEVQLAIIDGEPLLLSEFNGYLESFLDDDLEDVGTVSTRELFDGFLTQILLLREAEKSGIKISDIEVRQHLEEWSLTQGDTNTDEMKEVIRDYLKVQKLLKRAVNGEMEITLQELINHYDRNVEGFTVGDQAHVLEILCDTREQAEELKARINTGDSRKFREMAANFSRGATAEAEGDLGFFQKGDLPEEFDKVIFALKPGEISAPFQTMHGFHLFYMEEWIPSHQYKFHEVKAEIFRRIAAEKERLQTETYINSLKNQYSITIYESNFPADIKEHSFEQDDS